MTFRGDRDSYCPGKIYFLRTAERVLLCVGRFKARTFDELFEATKGNSVGRLYPGVTAKFWVKEGFDSKESVI